MARSRVIRSRAGWLILASGLLASACGRDPTPDADRCLAPPRRPAGLILAGSGSNLPLVRRIAERYQRLHPGSRIVIPQSIGTRGAVQALLDGAIDVGLASRSLSASERARGLRETPLARTRVVFAVNSSVNVSRLGEAELCAIYRGERRRWPDGAPVVPLLREPGDSSRAVLRRAHPALEAAIDDAFTRDRFRTCYTDAEMQRSLAALAGAIGFIDEGILRLEGVGLRILELEGSPSRLGLKPLHFVTRGAPRGEAERLIAFARSPAVAELLERGGYLAP